MRVKDYMTENVHLAAPAMTLLEAAEKMRDQNLGALPVGDGDRLVGMITDRDIVIRCVAEGSDPRGTLVREAMSKKILYCYEDCSLEEAARNFSENKIRRLPVLNRSKRMVGIFSLGDLAKMSEELSNGALKRITRSTEPNESMFET